MKSTSFPERYQPINALFKFGGLCDVKPGGRHALCTRSIHVLPSYKLLILHQRKSKHFQKIPNAQGKVTDFSPSHRKQRSPHQNTFNHSCTVVLQSQQVIWKYSMLPKNTPPTLKPEINSQTQPVSMAVIIIPHPPCHNLTP